MQQTSSFSVLQWIDQMQRLSRDGRCNSPTFFKPFHFVLLAMTLARRRAEALKVPTGLQTYAARMRLWHAIGLEPPVDVKPYVPEGRFLPVSRLDDEGFIPDIAASLAEITGTYGADADTKDAVMTSMMEIMGNCFAHARVNDPLKAVVCAQSWPQGNLAQIAIADCGIGVRDSLLENAEHKATLETENSCEFATRLGVTSKPQLGHAGYGLALTRQLLERAGGRLIVVSGNEWMQTRGLRLSTGTATQPWTGTVAVLEWRTKSPLRLKDVYENWPLPAGFEHDDFDFED